MKGLIAPASLIAITAIDATAEALLNVYARGGRIGWIAVSLALYGLSCWLYIYMLRAYGFGVSVMLSTTLLVSINMLTAVFVFNERFSLLQCFGLGIATLGVLLLLIPSNTASPA